VRIELFVDDPQEAQAKAIAAGGRLGSPVEMHTHATRGGPPLRLDSPASLAALVLRGGVG